VTSILNSTPGDGGEGGEERQRERRDYREEEKRAWTEKKGRKKERKVKEGRD